MLIAQVPSLVSGWHLWQGSIVVPSDVLAARLLFINSSSLLLCRPCRLQLPLVESLFLLDQVADEEQLVLTPLMEEVEPHLNDVFGLSLAWLLEVFKLSTDSNRKLASSWGHFISITCR